MNRRQVLGKTLLGLGGGALSLLAPKSAQAVLPPADCSPATAEGVFARDIRCLPHGLVELTTATGDTVEILVSGTGPVASGITTLTFKQLAVLEGLWQVHKPGTFLDQKPIHGTDPLVGSFDPLTYYGPTGVTGSTWVYRHPVDVPGTVFKGVNNYPMYLELDQQFGPALPPLRVDLVSFEIGFGVRDSTQLALLPYSPLPTYTVLKTIQFPAGVGQRKKWLGPIQIPWNVRLLGIVLQTPLEQFINLRLRSTHPFGGLEIA